MSLVVMRRSVLDRSTLFLEMTDLDLELSESEGAVTLSISQPET